MTGNTELKIHVPKTFYAGEVTSGRCVSNVNDFNSIFVIMTVTSDGNCTVNRSKEIETVGTHYQKNFSIICASGNHTVSCSTNGRHHINKVKPLQGIYNCNAYILMYIYSHTMYTYIHIYMTLYHKYYVYTVLKRPSPEIINKPCNVTIAVGLPITFRCYVKGEPNHYWVGWMSRNTIITPGKDYSISTSQSFLSANGTTHYLTVHEVKEAGKYDCKVYSLEGNVEDFITHEVIISNGMDKYSNC